MKLSWFRATPAVHGPMSHSTSTFNDPLFRYFNREPAATRLSRELPMLWTMFWTKM